MTTTDTREALYQTINSSDDTLAVLALADLIEEEATSAADRHLAKSLHAIVIANGAPVACNGKPRNSPGPHEWILRDDTRDIPVAHAWVSKKMYGGLGGKPYARPNSRGEITVAFPSKVEAILALAAILY